MDIHFIGTLQTNKVRQVVGRVDLIESVGSEHLLDAIEAFTFTPSQIDFLQSLIYIFIKDTSIFRQLDIAPLLVVEGLPVRDWLTRIECRVEGDRIFQ